MTLQKFQIDLELQRDISPGTVIVLDEVSMVSIPQLCRLVAFNQLVFLLSCGYFKAAKR